MSHLIQDLKSYARILHRQVQHGDRDARRRLRQLKELNAIDSDSLGETTQRRHCLAVVAQELGFSGWSQASAVLAGQETEDFGTLLYPKGAFAHSNIWSASYGEAARIREETGGYLLVYRRQFFIVDQHFIETLGLDPKHPDWEGIGWDWARPRDSEARQRLYAEVVWGKLPRLIHEKSVSG
ncbi:MAG: hypothetical protein K0U98_17965 [Deltaproteobacteria bacterium]|nr:hypothetical protein [Deltaproteobacteria bacterium]